MSSTKFCPNCGAQIHANSQFCSFCGTNQNDPRPPSSTGQPYTPPPGYQQSIPYTEKEHVSSLWYLAPILLAVIGGIVAWYMNKDKDPGKARNFLILGVILTLVPILIFLWWLMMMGVLF